MATLKEIDTQIKKIGGSKDKLNGLVQSTAVAIVEHAAEHGDCTRALALVKALGSAMNRTMLVNWFAYYAPIGMNVAQDRVGFIKHDSKRYRPFDIDGARTNPWFDPNSVPANVRPEAIPDTLLEFDGKIINFVERLRKVVEDEAKFGDPNNPGRTEEMKAQALAQLDAIENIATKGMALVEADQLEARAADLRKLAAA